MRSALSYNEMEILGRQVGTLTYQLSEITRLLESRLGADDDLAALARRAQEQFDQFAQCLSRRRAAPEGARPASSQTA
jgi:hypothetical protein